MHKRITVNADKEINKRLEGLQEAMTVQHREQQMTNGHCCNDKIGTFRNPAENCGQIAYEHPNTTSGKVHVIWDTCVCTLTEVVHWNINFLLNRLLLATEYEWWLCSESVL